MILKSLLRYPFSLFKLSTKELQTELRSYRLWSIPKDYYDNMQFDYTNTMNPNLFRDVIRNKNSLEQNNSLVDKVGLHFASKNPALFSEQELLVLANIDFVDGKNPLTKLTLEHIINVGVTNKNTSVITKLLLCLQSKHRMATISRIQEEMIQGVELLKQQEIIEALVLLQKCLSMQLSESPKQLIPSRFTEKCMLLGGKAKLAAEAISYSMGMQIEVDRRCVQAVIEQDQLSLEIIYSLYLLKDNLNLTNEHKNRLFEHFYKKLIEVNEEVSWMIVSIFSRLNETQKLFVCQDIPLEKLHHLDYILYLEVLQRSDIEVQAKAFHQFPFWVKHKTDPKAFQRLLTLRFDIKYDLEQRLLDIITQTMTKNLACLKGIILFLSDFEFQSQATPKLISKILLSIAKSPTLQGYDIMDFYKTIALFAKHDLGSSRFWRGVQSYLLLRLDEAIELSNYMSSLDKEDFITNIVMLLKNHFGKSKIQELVLNQIKLSLQQLWSIEHLEQLCANLLEVGLGENEIWALIQDNLELMRKETKADVRVVKILIAMMRIGKGSGNYWRRIAEILPPQWVEMLKAEALSMKKNLMISYLMEGSLRRHKLQ